MGLPFKIGGDYFSCLSSKAHPGSGKSFRGNIGNANRGFLALVHVSCVFVAHERNAERAELALDVARIVSRFLFVSSSQVAARIWSPSVSSRGIGVGHGAEAVGICIH